MEDGQGNQGGQAYDDPPEAKQDQVQEQQQPQQVQAQAQPAQQQQQQQPQQQQQQAQPQAQQQQPQAQQQQMAAAQPAQYNNVVDKAPEKPITEWNVEETLGYLKHAVTLNARNDFKLTQACRYLTQLATDPEQCQEILSCQGLDIVFDVMKATAGDVAIQMSCCAATVVLCANPASKQYPAKTNGIFYISQGIKDNLNYGPFVILAFNAVCNFCHDHAS